MEKNLIVKINGVEREVIINDVYTRKTDKEYNSILFKGTNFGVEKEKFQINQDNVQDANDYLVEAMTNLSKEDIENLANNDYQEVLKRVMEVKDPLLKKDSWLNNSEKPWGQIEG